MALSKNHAARLKKVDASLDRAMDGLMQANGQLWPRELRPLGDIVQKAVDILKDASKNIQARLNDEIVNDAAEPDQGDPNQEDIEDVKGVAQPQPEADELGEPPAGSPASRRRRATA